MHVLLAYAAADGREPAGRLAELLRAMEVTPVDAAGDAPAPPGAGVIAVLTPAALADQAVLAQLQAAPAQGRPLLPLSAPDPASFPSADDLARLVEWRNAPAPDQSAKYHVVNAINCAIGNYAVTVNNFGTAAGWSAAETAQFVAALRGQQPGVPMTAQELRQRFADVQAQLQQVERALRQGFLLVLARFDAHEQRILAPILARFDSQQAELTAAILDALESRTFPAHELEQHMAAIHIALAEINARAAQIADRQLTEATQKLAEVATDPGLDAKHKLKVTIPIVPLLLEYEGELELSSRLNLRKIWNAMAGWAGNT